MILTTLVDGAQNGKTDNEALNIHSPIYPENMCNIGTITIYCSMCFRFLKFNWNGYILESLS